MVKLVPSTDQLSVQTFPVRFTRIQKGAFAPLMATLACTVGLLFTKLSREHILRGAVGVNIEAQVIVGIGLNDDALVLTPSSGKRIELHCAPENPCWLLPAESGRSGFHLTKRSWAVPAGTLRTASVPFRLTAPSPSGLTTVHREVFRLVE